MGKGNKQTTTQNQTQSSTSSTQLPQWVTNQAQSNLGLANTVANNYQTPMQQTPAGFTPDQLAAFNMISNAAQNAGANNPANQYAMNMTQQAGNWQAPQVYAPGYTAQNVAAPQGYQAAQMGPVRQVNAQNVSAQQMQMDPITAALMQASLVGPAQNAVAATGTASQIDPSQLQQVTGPDTAAQIGGFMQAMNPALQNDVYNTTLTQLDKARQMTLQQNAAQAAQAGAFDSSRQGVMDAITNTNFAQQAAQTAANLNLQGFQTGLGALQNQQGLQQQAALANQAQAASVAAQNAQLAQGMSLANVGNQQQTGLANQAAQNQFTLSNQAMQQQANAANQAAQNQIALANQANNFGVQQGNQSANLQASLANQQAALQAGEFNVGNQMQSGLANQAALNAAGQFNSGQGFQAGLANQSAQNTAGQYNAGQNLQAFLANQAASQAQAGLQLQAGAQAGNLGNTGFGQQMAAYQALLGAGGQQQQYGQNVLDTAYQNALAQNQNPLQQLMILQQALQSTPYGTTTTSSGNMSGQTVQQQQPGLMGMLGQAAQLVAPFFSDIRLKENITPMSPAADVRLGPHMRDPLKAVRRIRPVHYTWKGAPMKPQLGLIAQNVQQAAPEAVSDIPTGHPAMPTVKAVHPNAMFGLLTGAIQQLDNKVSRRKGVPIGV